MFGPDIDCGCDKKGHAITLRSPRIKEARFYRDWICDPIINQYLSNGEHYTLQQEREWMRQVRDDENRWLWSIWADEVLIGNAGLRINPVLNTGVTGIIIGDTNYWKMGIAFRVFAARARFAFTEVGCVALFTEAYQDNESSWGANEKLGFVRYGERPFAALVNGEYTTVYEACLSRKHWQELNHA